MKVHVHSEQFDGARHAWCGRTDSNDANRVLTEREFAASPPDQRCAVCHRDQFRNGQPDWHLEASRAELQRDQAPTRSAA